MYGVLSTDNATFIRLTGRSVAEFDQLYGTFAAAWRTMAAEQWHGVTRTVAPGAGRKFTVNCQDQLLAVLLWSHLALHPQAISQLLNIHISTFARIRQRVLTILARLDVTIPPPARGTYKVLDELVDSHPALLHVGKQQEPGCNQALVLG